MVFQYNEWERVIWFMFGLVTASVNQKYGWWGLITIPIWIITSYYLKRLWDWKPAQRTINDFEKPPSHNSD